jgi:pSer/pThr/pTyr-binding forkhead associated (FHA) protein
MPKLVMKRVSQLAAEFPLQKTSVTIGRLPTNDIVLDDGTVSGQHARLVFDEGRFLVQDLNSLNGTFVNDQFARRTVLKNQDEIRVGNCTLAFVDEGLGGPLQVIDRTVRVQRTGATAADMERTQTRLPQPPPPSRTN